MSGASTFSAPAGPTVGLQGYNLDRRVKNLDPSTSHVLRQRLRRAAARRAKQRRGQELQKDHVMTDAIKPMVDTLARSVSDIVAAGGDERDALLAKGFGEFLEALNQRVGASVAEQVADDLAKRAPAEEPLFKGLGTVGRVANLVSQIATQTAQIKAGKDWWGGPPGTDQHASVDPPSEEVEAYLDQCLASAELAMRAAVNEHVDIADDDDEDGEGQRIVVLKSADGAEDIRVKTALPEELAKFACDPAALDQALLDQACGTLLAFGVKEEVLGKVLGGDDLAKAFPPGPSASMRRPAAPAPGGGAQETEQAQDPEQDAEGEDGNDPVEMLQVAGRLAAALMIQLDGISRLIEGEEGAEGETDANAAGDPNQPAAQEQAGEGAGQAAGGAGEEEGKKRNPFAKAADGPDVAALAKGVVDEQVGALRKEFGSALDDIKATLNRVLQLPQAPKAILGELGHLSKAADTPGTEIDLSPENVAMVLEKMAPDDKAAAIYQIQRGAAPGRVLAKHL